jgi:uncharacterized membrane protein YGL010W
MQAANVNKLTNLKYWFNEYLKDHTTEGNIKAHYIGLPTVTISLLGLLDIWIQIPLENTNIGGGLILLIIALAWYIVLDTKLAALIVIPIGALYFLSTKMSLQAHIAVQVIGWLFQLFGHYKFEGKSPAFFKSLPQLLIGPFFMFAKIINYDWKNRD